MVPMYCHSGGKHQPQILDPEKFAHIFGDEILREDKSANGLTITLLDDLCMLH